MADADIAARASSWDRATNGPFKPALYNLDADIGETTNLISEQPELAVMLIASIHRAQADFRLNGRPRGWVADSD